jgi:hypothetical protein
VAISPSVGRSSCSPAPDGCPDHGGAGRRVMGGDQWRGKRRTRPEGTPSEQADLVDVFYAQFVRPLGNLVILCAQAEAAWLQLVAGLTGCTEKEAQRFLQMKGPNAKQEIVPLAQTSGIEGFDLQELSESIEKYYCDRERRHRLMHDEWYVSLLQAVGVPRTRGLPRKKGAAVVWGDSTPDDIWKLALRFREYENLFSYVTYDVQQRKKAPS